MTQHFVKVVVILFGAITSEKTTKVISQIFGSLAFVKTTRINSLYPVTLTNSLFTEQPTSCSEWEIGLRLLRTMSELYVSTPIDFSQ